MEFLRGQKPKQKWPILCMLLAGLFLRADDNRRLLGELGSDSFAAREAAERALWKQGAHALADLRLATGGDDPEIVLRASRLVRLMELGIFPDTPPEVAQLLRDIPSYSTEEMMRTLGPNLADPVKGKVLLGGMSAWSRRRGAEEEFATLLRPALASAIDGLVGQGREREAADLLAVAARGGLHGFARQAAEAAWFVGKITDLENHMLQGPPQAGDGRLRAWLAFHRGDYERCASLASSHGESSLAAIASALRGDWSHVQEVFGRPGPERSSEQDTLRLAQARLRGLPDEAMFAERKAMTLLPPSPGNGPGALEVLWLNDAWPAFMDYFANLDDPVLEAEYAFLLMQPDRFARISRKAWAKSDPHRNRHHILSWSHFLTGSDPVENSSEIKEAEGLGWAYGLDAPGAGTERDTPEDWAKFLSSMQNEARFRPTSPATKLIMGWAEKRNGHERESEANLRSAGWDLILRRELDPSRLKETLARRGEEPYWARVVDLIHHLNGDDLAYVPFLEALFARAMRGQIGLLEAIGWFELARLELLKPNHPPPGQQPCAFLSRRLAELRMHAALAAGDLQRAKAELDSHLDVLLGQGGEIHARLGDAGATSLAKEFALRVIDRLSTLFHAHPRAIAPRHQAATLAASAQVRVAEALTLLEESIQANVRMPIHIEDTRAQLLLLLGRRTEAMAIAEKNARTMPRSEYYKKRVEGMRATLPP